MQFTILRSGSTGCGPGSLTSDSAKSKPTGTLTVFKVELWLTRGPSQPSHWSDDAKSTLHASWQAGSREGQRTPGASSGHAILQDSAAPTILIGYLVSSRVGSPVGIRGSDNPCWVLCPALRMRSIRVGSICAVDVNRLEGAFCWWDVPQLVGGRCYESSVPTGPVARGLSDRGLFSISDPSFFLRGPQAYASVVSWRCQSPSAH